MAADLTAWGRGLFGCSLAMSWGGSMTQIVSAHRPVYARIDARALVPRTADLASAAAASAVFAVALACFVRGFRLGTSALLIAALMAALRRIETRQWPGDLVVGLGKYVPALACLCGFLAAYAASSGANREACGWAAACGVAGACHALAGWAKLRTPGWAEARHIGALVAERSYRGWGWTRALRRWLSSRPRLCGLLGATAIWSEMIGGLLFLWPPARLSVALAMAATHAGIFLFLGYFEPEWILLLFGLAWTPIA
jgi:hypothetical protein